VEGGGKKETKEKRKGEGKEEKIRIKTLPLATGERGGGSRALGSKENPDLQKIV